MKNIIRFFVILLALTLIARGTAGATLPRVSLASPERAEIIDSIRGQATVYASDNIEITVLEGLRIAETHVNTGQSIKPGDPIATFDMDYLEELHIRKSASLSRMELDLQALDHDASAINNALRNLNRAQADYSAAQASDSSDTLRNYQRALEDYFDTLVQGNAEISLALQALQNISDAQLQNAKRNHERAIEDYYITRAQGEEEIAAARRRRESTADRSAVENAQRALQRAREDYHSEENRIAATRRIEDAEAALSQAQRVVRNITQTERDQAAQALEDAQNRAAEAIFTAQRRVEDTESALSQAQAALDDALSQAQKAYEAARTRAADNIQSARRRMEDAEAAIQNTIDAENNNRLSAARQVEDASLALANARQQAEDTAIDNRITATTLRLDIATKQAEIYTLENLIAADGVLYANYTGTVSYITQTGESPIVTLRDTEGGFHAQLTVERRQAERLYVGSESEVTSGRGSMFFMPTVTGIVSSISAPDDNDRVSVTITLPEDDWHTGQQVDAQVILSRENFDFSVPISALRSDNMGYFLLVKEQHSTVMGLQNVVLRVNVTLIASDEERASVLGAIDRNSQIITGSNKAVSVGDRIRVE